MTSNAVAANRISEVVGYLLDKGDFSTTTPNLPIAIAVFGEANTANQSGLSTAQTQITSAQQAGTLYGFGSPLHAMMRKFFPSNGGSVPCPVYAFPQAAASGATAEVQTITVTGTATGNGTIYIQVAGRENIDGGSYAVSILSTDTASNVATKIYNAINAVLSAPVIATVSSGVVTLTSKWTGLTAHDITISVDLNNTSTGFSFAVAETTAGSGTPLVATSLGLIGNQWIPILVNGYGLVAQTIGELETFNGVPDSVSPTGRYQGIYYKPIVALSGTVLDNPTSITGATARTTQPTIVACPAPLSPGLSCEVAAAYAYALANILVSTPHLDVMNTALIDVPIPALGTIPAMNDYNTRDTYVQAGCSTVELTAGQYVIKDLVTTYNKAGEFPPQYRFVRDIFIDMEVGYAWRLMIKSNFMSHTLCADGDVVTADNIVQPSMVVTSAKALAADLGKRALIADVQFMQQSIQASINPTNPNRLDVIYEYKRTGMGRIAAITAKAGFNFGN